MIVAPTSPNSIQANECTAHLDATNKHEKAADTKDSYPENAELTPTSQPSPETARTFSEESRFPSKAYLLMIIDKYRARCEAEAALVRPEETDVLLGRGRGHTNHPGNQKYLQKVDEYGSQYDSARTYAETIRITKEIVKYINESGRFLRFDKSNGIWVKVDHETARRKASQDLRNRRRPKRASSKFVADSEAEEVEEQRRESLCKASLPRNRASHNPFFALLTNCPIAFFAGGGYECMGGHV